MDQEFGELLCNEWGLQRSFGTEPIDVADLRLGFVLSSKRSSSSYNGPDGSLMIDDFERFGSEHGKFVQDFIATCLGWCGIRKVMLVSCPRLKSTASGRGGQPGIKTSTGMIVSMP